MFGCKSKQVKAALGVTKSLIKADFVWKYAAEQQNMSL